MTDFDLLSPAGNLEKLKVAILYGANSVFIGGKSFSLRQRASNFTIEDIKEACLFAKMHNSNVHVTCNIVMHESDTQGILEYLKELDKCGVFAVITSSIYILKLVKTHTSMECHISTQDSVTNSYAVKLYKSLGADRVVLARECDMDDIKYINDLKICDIEVFVHGGMCSSFSGRCMLSNIMTNRDANRGGCAHSCRWNYNIYKDNIMLNKENDFFSMSSKDLNSVSVFKKLLDLGVKSFKIEGRMKSLHYVASITNVYRLMIDTYLNNITLDILYFNNLIHKAENRLTSVGFYNNKLTHNEQLYDLNKSLPTKAFVGIVKDYNKDLKRVIVEQRNYLKNGDILEVLSPRGTYKLEVINLKDIDNNEIDYCPHPLSIVSFSCDIELKEYDMLRLF